MGDARGLRSGRDRYAEVGRRLRYSLTCLHRPLSPAALVDLGRRDPWPSPTALAVHGVVAGGFLASWSKYAETLRWPLHAIADVMGRDPVADSEGGELGEGNGARGKATRDRISAALRELEVRGALEVRTWRDRSGFFAEVTLPAVPVGWVDPTYAHPAAAPVEAGSASSELAEGSASSEGAEGVSEGLLGELGGGRPASSEGAGRLAPRGPFTRSDREVTSEQASGRLAAVGVLETADARRLAADVAGARASGADEHVAALAGLLPAEIVGLYPAGADALAAAVLGHGAEQHRPALARLRRHLELSALEDLRVFLAAKGRAVRGPVRSPAGLVLSWLSDLSAEPVPDAMRAAVAAKAEAKAAEDARELEAARAAYDARPRSGPPEGWGDQWRETLGVVGALEPGGRS